MKAGSKMKELKTCYEITNHEVAAVSNCGMEGEAAYYCVDAIPDDAGYFTTVIVRRR